MIHPDTELRFKNPTIGSCVVATRFIPRGTVVWTLCALDRAIAPEERERIPLATREVLDKYAYIDARGDHVLCWDHGRFINHSCEPAMRGVGADHEIAIRDLQVGDELTCDYGILNLISPLDCLCGSARCRGRIDAADALRADADYESLVRGAIAAFPKVSQPLTPYMLDPANLESVVTGRQPLPRMDTYHRAPLRRVVPS